MEGNIYCITNTVNNKQYIGKTTLNINARFSQHKRDAKRFPKRPLYAAMLKYGTDVFTIELLEKVNIQQLDDREKYWIEKKETYHNGYNATRGGDGSILYDYEAITDDYLNGMLIQEISKKYGCDNGTIRKILVLSNIDTSLNSKIHKSSPVVAINRQGEVIKFCSYTEAAQWLYDNHYTKAEAIRGIVANISRAVSKKRQTYLGFRWEEI